MKHFLALLLLAGGTAAAQQPSAPPAAAVASGQVSGIVRCHDTGRPCRFAGIVLLPETAPNEPPLPALNLAAPGDESARILATAMVANWSRAAALSAIADLQGRFSIDKVPVGAYYVIAELPGYVSAVSGLSKAERDHADARTLATVESRAR